MRRYISKLTLFAFVNLSGNGALPLVFYPNTHGFGDNDVMYMAFFGLNISLSIYLKIVYQDLKKCFFFKMKMYNSKSKCIFEMESRAFSMMKQSFW